MGIMTQLSLQEILESPNWALMASEYEQLSQVEKLEGRFVHSKGIHGVRHARRVLFHTLILCELCRVSGQDKSLLILAALYHDIGRDRDDRCLVHGRQSAIKMTALGLMPSDREEAELVKFIVAYHCIDDSRAQTALQDLPERLRGRAWRLYTVLNDADGLDRVRINDLDVSYLRNHEALRLESLAYELFETM